MLEDFDPLEPESHPFSMNGLIGSDRDGKIKTPGATPTFRTKHYIVFWDGGSYSYENVAFAFYFPHEGSFMRVEKYTKQYFDHSLCIRTQPSSPAKFSKWKCPDKPLEDIRT